jgi:hypothetical protein
MSTLVTSAFPPLSNIQIPRSGSVWRRYSITLHSWSTGIRVAVTRRGGCLGPPGRCGLAWRPWLRTRPHCWPGPARCSMLAGRAPRTQSLRFAAELRMFLAPRRRAGAVGSPAMAFPERTRVRNSPSTTAGSSAARLGHGGDSTGNKPSSPAPELLGHSILALIAKRRHKLLKFRSSSCNRRYRPHAAGGRPIDGSSEVECTGGSQACCLRGPPRPLPFRDLDPTRTPTAPTAEPPRSQPCLNLVPQHIRRSGHDRDVSEDRLHQKAHALLPS